MKRILPILLLAVVGCRTDQPPADERTIVDIPDLNFRRALIEELGRSEPLPTNEIYKSQVKEIRFLNVDQKNISSLQGIEKFTGLTELNCGGNDLTNLNVSANTNLTSLNCGNNILTGLDLSANTKLTGLECGWNRLTSLDVSANTNLSGLGCSGNNLTSLDVSANTDLWQLDCSENNLTNLDVSANTKMAWLNCQNNSLTNLNISGTASLRSLDCGFNKLATLDVSVNTDLFHLDCNGNNLTNLDVSANRKLKFLFCCDNNLTNIVDFSSSTTLHPQSPRGEKPTHFSAPATQTASSSNFSPRPTTFDSVAMLTLPIIMRGVYSNRTPGARGMARGMLGGSAMTEGAVMRCLRWLKKTQNEGGSWGGKDEPKPVATGIALLVFLAHCETPASEEFGESVKSAILFLQSIQKDDGSFGGTDETPALQHAIVTFALCESYGVTRHPEIGPACDKAAKIIITQQNASGLWGMEYGKEDDLEASIWQVRALRSALTAGLDEERLRPVLRRAAEALKKTIERDKMAKRTGPATLCLQCLGYIHDPVCKSGIDALDGLTMNWEEPEFENPVYHWHFITQAIFHHGGNVWKDWNLSFASQLVRNQHVIPEAIEGLRIEGLRKGKMRDIGYWTSPGKDERYGKIYSSALCCLMLENYYRYLPMFRNPIDVEEKKNVQEDNVEINAAGVGVHAKPTSSAHSR